MNQPGFEFRCFRQPFIRDRIAITLVNTRLGKFHAQMSVAQPVQMVEVDTEGMQLPELMSVRPDEAQQLMDELWRIGIRPTEGAGSVGQLAAVQYHLEDMRKLVFKNR